MPRVAFLTASCMLAGSPDARSDAWEHELEYPLLHASCAELDIQLDEQVWDDPSLDPGAFDAYVIGTTWDYMEKRERFDLRLAQLAAKRPLHNPLEVVRWNLDKRYLQQLSARGAPVIPTLWRERAEPALIAAAFDELGADELVVKPLVGASAWRQARVRRGDPLPPAAELPPAATMIQPYLPSVVSTGEVSFVFFAGVFSHAVLKLPAPGDYRVQSMYGAREEVYEPTPEELSLARRVLDAVGVELLYARVDMVRDAAGELVLMELELVEPYFYPEQGPRSGEVFAAALDARLGDTA